MNKNTLFISLFLILILASCNLPQPKSPGEAYLIANSEPQAWIDAPLNESHLPLAPYEVVYHITDQEGVALGELSINDQVVASLPNPNPSKKLGTLKFLWDPAAPDRYLLSVRCQNTNGVWGPAAESVVFIGEKTTTPNPILTPTMLLTPTYTPTIAPTSTPYAGFSNFSAAPSSVFYGNCTPNQVSVNVQAVDPAGITTVVLFYRLRGENGNATEWLNVAMNPQGADQFNKTVDIKYLARQTGFTQQKGILEIQLVIQNTQTEMTRSQVYADVAVHPCGLDVPVLPRITVMPGITVVPLLPTKTPIIIK
ncbi:MAG: hypothetical protein JXR32_03960 [Anaerolineaceae bacterium]|nr:hypothetical protein [Anaerolineaceae bacterium]